jgi:hypothetical protein
MNYRYQSTHSMTYFRQIVGLSTLGVYERGKTAMSNPMERATAYLSKLEADRMAALELSKEKALEAMLIKAREEGFREAVEIFGLNIDHDVAPNDIEIETDKSHKRRRRDIRQMIFKELSYSAKAMTIRQIAKAIDYLPERTETALRRLANEGKIAQNQDGLWEVVIVTGDSPNRLAVAA